MKLLLRLSVSLLGIFVLVSCQSTYNPLDEFEQIEPGPILSTPEPLPSTNFSSQEISRGKYLVGLLACGSCHTDGALNGSPNPDYMLAGSRTGIAYTSPLENANPAVVYPANLTPDIASGLGNRSVDELVQMITVSSHDHSARKGPVMPRIVYADMTAQDALSIAAYLKSLTPVYHQVPDNVERGQRAKSSYVHFGVYRKR